MKSRPFSITNLELRLASLYLIGGALLRFVLWWSYGQEGSVSFGKLLPQLFVGMINDVVVLLYCFLLVSVVKLFIPNRHAGTKLWKSVVTIGTLLVLAGGVFLIPAEYLFFDEFDCRFNLVAVDYIAYPTEVLGNIRESYPVPLVLSVVGAGALLLLSLVWKSIWHDSSNNRPAFRKRLANVVSLTFLVACLIKFVSTDTFAFSSNRVVNELGSNGVSSFFRAALNSDIEYDRFYATIDPQEAVQVVRKYLSSTSGGTFSNEAPTSLVRQHQSLKPENRYNVVVLGQESLGAQYVGAYGDTRGLTPHFDELAKKSILFSNAYATGTRTVRGLEAMNCSFPPIPSESIVKRPGNAPFANIGSLLMARGYNAMFLYGGFGAFDSMNSFFGGNGWELSDRTEIRSPQFSNIWGVSDEDLFTHSIEKLTEKSKSDKPFFAFIMSTSNHKPFTFRKGLPGIPPSGGGRLAGVKYADYAIGHFFKLAEKTSWFDRTIFVVIADHDSRVYGRAEIPVEHYKIPAIIYAPKILAPRVVDKTFSQIDLVPTILGLLGVSYTAPFYGANVLDENVPKIRPVLISHNHDVAMYEQNTGRLTVLGLNRINTSYKYENGKTRRIETDPEALRQAIALYQVGYDLYKTRQFQLPVSALSESSSDRR